LFDSHIHIGQFEEIYYDPAEIIGIVMEKAEGLCFSSTTTCKDGVSYSEIENEIDGALARIDWPPETVRPFFWYTPCFAEQGVPFEKAVKNLPYKGVKLHPLAHKWDLEDTKFIDMLHAIFDYAGKNSLPVLIHTGNNGVDAAGTFSRFFPLYPETKFILAHCRPLVEAISLLREHPNVYGDTAFMPAAEFIKIIKKDLSGKMIFGSDFPITNYFYNNNLARKRRAITLKEQYKRDYSLLMRYEIYSRESVD